MLFDTNFSTLHVHPRATNVSLTYLDVPCRLFLTNCIDKRQQELTGTYEDNLCHLSAASFNSNTFRKSSWRRLNRFEKNFLQALHRDNQSLRKIISGGQTGADIAGLDVAIKHEIPHGGAIPKGILTEAGSLPEKYNLQEMATNSYPKRTEKNVVDSDGTVIFLM